MRRRLNERDSNAQRLYSTPLPASRRGPLFNAFSYPTKIHAETVALFIACHTRPGDVVLDVFAGSGTTGVAAILCERPTAAMREIAARAGVEPAWGPRNAVLYELSVVGSLLARVMTSPPDPGEFAAAAKHLVDTARVANSELYVAADGTGNRGDIRHVVWSEIVTCPSCGGETTYADVRVRFGPLRFTESHKCPCGFIGHPDEWLRTSEEVFDRWSGRTVVRRRRAPWKIYGRTGTRNWSRDAIAIDAEGEVAARALELPPSTPLKALRWGDLHRGGYHQGITHLHDLYTARNFYAVATLWSLIDQEPAPVRDALKLLVLSYNATHSTLMTRVVLKKNSRDFVVTGAQSGVLYVSALPVEKNVFSGVRRKIAVFRRAFELMHGAEATVDVRNESSTHLEIRSGSIDYAFTDPPFGANIPYSEVNQVNELWLDQTTDTTDEAIVSQAQGKDLTSYESLLTRVFKEVERVMKPTADLTLVFHSAHAEVWQALARSLHEAGLGAVGAGVLDREQLSFKQVNGHTFVSGDPLLLVRRRQPQGRNIRASRRSPQEVQGGTPASAENAGNARREKQHRYSRLVSTAVVNGTPITVDAKAFYASESEKD